MELTGDFRNLTKAEIDTLKRNGCASNDWGRVNVKNGFEPDRCINVTFSGDVTLGTFKGQITDDSGVIVLCGIYNARIHNCAVGSDVVIRNIGDYIANYTIEDNVSIVNCGRIHTEGITSFGNGTEVAVLNETGGRSVKIWDNLSSHEAYIRALYRHKTTVISILDKMVDEYSLSVSSETGIIGYGSRIINSNTIRNVRFDRFSLVEGVVRLNEGSVNSSEADPVIIGPGVIMDNFIVCSGSSITKSVIIDKCFIGQACVLSKHYSAENSLFFANCGGYHGEACSIFGGPFTVSHHKSTLLISGIFSFMNAGSGSNQSNHMYKLGPIHQGIIERGSKTTSDSYLLWPARIGPFTLVMGRHYKNMDTTSLPFSYLIESKDESILVPGINLKSVGTMRDAQKWPLRDCRKDSVKIDKIHYNLLSPYTIRKMFEGREILQKLKSEGKFENFFYQYGDMKIKKSALERGIELYQIGINKFLGNSLIKRLENRQFNTNEELRERLYPANKSGRGEWIDLAGLIVPKQEIEVLLENIESGKITSIKSLSESFITMYNSYHDWEWSWSCERIEEETGISIDKFSATDVIDVVERWKKSVIELDNLLYEDARKEFTLASMTGFGIDGGEDEKLTDFESVRGEFESNSVVAAIREHIKRKSTLGDELISRMKNIG